MQRDHYRKKVTPRSLLYRMRVGGMRDELEKATRIQAIWTGYCKRLGRETPAQSQKRKYSSGKYITWYFQVDEQGNSPSRESAGQTDETQKEVRTVDTVTNSLSIRPTLISCEYDPEIRIIHRGKTKRMKMSDSHQLNWKTKPHYIRHVVRLLRL